MGVTEITFGDELAMGAGAMAATAFVHAVFVATAGVVLRTADFRAWGPVRFVRDVFALVVVSVWLMAAHAVEIAMWAWIFLHVEAFDALEPALYFASVCYTTLGFGDVLLPEPTRLLAGACAANGLLLFGLSAAFLFDASMKLRLGGDMRR